MAAPHSEKPNRVPEGVVKGGLVYPITIGEPSKAPIDTVGPGGDVFEYIVGPGPPNPAPIGRIGQDGNYHGTFVGGLLNSPTPRATPTVSDLTRKIEKSR